MGSAASKNKLAFTPNGAGKEGLAALEALYQQDLEFLNLPVAKWTPAKTTCNGDPVLDVLIIGAGQAGIALATALKHLGVEAKLVDKAPEGYEGPWDTTARMETLRSSKQLVGPALGFAHLTFRAWFTAQFGTAAWEALGKIPRQQWMDYLRWFKTANGLTVENNTEVRLVQPGVDGVVTVELQKTSPFAKDASDAQLAPTHKVYARHVVLATGRDGLGGPWVPGWASQVPTEKRVHSSDVWDAHALSDKHVVVIGGGSSAMDCAGTALEHGAAEVHLLIRRHDLPCVNKSKAAVGPGITHGYLSFTDGWKWQFRHYMNLHIPPPHGSTLRVSRHPNAFFHFDTAVQKATVREDGKVRLDTSNGPIAADCVIFATGFATDWAQRPEFAPFAQHVQQWGDVYTPPPALASTELAQSPYLGSHFEFLEKEKGSCPGLGHVHCFCYPATLSHGAVSGDIPQITDGVRMLAQGLTGDLYNEDVQFQFAEVEKFDDPELDGKEWTPAPWPAYTE